MKITYAAKTDTGRVRKENQDSYGVVDAVRLYVVCDGMGGGAAGDFASKCAVDVISHAVARTDEKELRAVAGLSFVPADPRIMRPAAAIRLANRALHNLTDKYSKLAGMGTTIVALLLDEQAGIAHIYHVGDSRVYRFRAGRLEQLTRDHSKINELLDQGKMSVEEVKTAEIQSMITRALGTAATVKIDYRREALKPGDLFLLCTDGLNGEIDDTVIGDILSIHRNDIGHAAQELILAANNAGGKDNTTVLVAGVEGDAVPVVADPNEQFGVVTTILDETPDQTAAEDRTLRSVLPAIQLKVPAAARDNSLFAHPFILAVLFLLLALGGVYIYTHLPRHAPATGLKELAGSVTGLQLSVRTPTPDQLAKFFAATDDTIAQMQMMQDWIRESDRLTMPLENAQVIVLANGAEQFKGLSSVIPTDIKVPRGAYALTVRYPGYVVCTERMERRDTVAVTVESATALKSTIIIMLPAEQ